MHRTLTLVKHTPPHYDTQLQRRCNAHSRTLVRCWLCSIVFSTGCSELQRRLTKSILEYVILAGSSFPRTKQTAWIRWALAVRAAAAARPAARLCSTFTEHHQSADHRFTVLSPTSRIRVRIIARLTQSSREAARDTTQRSRLWRAAALARSRLRVRYQLACLQ